MSRGATRRRAAPHGAQLKKIDSEVKIFDPGVFGHAEFEYKGPVSLSQTIGSQSGKAGKNIPD
jgi:hypothetical protein